MQAGWQLRPNIASPLAPPHASDHVAPLFSRPQLVGHYHVTSSLARLLRLLTNSLTDSHLPNWRFLEKGKTFKNFSWLWIWLGRLVQFSWGGKRQHKVCTGAWNARIMKRVRQEGIFQFWPSFNLPGDLCPAAQRSSRVAEHQISLHFMRVRRVPPKWLNTLAPSVQKRTSECHRTDIEIHVSSVNPPGAMPSHTVQCSTVCDQTVSRFSTSSSSSQTPSTLNNTKWFPSGR